LPESNEERSVDSGHKRDWTSIREWTNLAVACGALLVAVVSVWTTAQISGVEDYFRSEISRRNSDLNSLADQGRRLGAIADERERRLAVLQTATEQITASNLAAQGKLISTQEEVSRLGIQALAARQQIANSKARLADLSAKSGEQVSLIDLFRRQRFFEQAYMRIVWGELRAGEANKPYTGEVVYQSIINWPASAVTPDLAPYLPEFRANARSTCEWIRSFTPAEHKRLEFPEAPSIPGKPVGDGTSYRMSQRDYDAWIAARDAWSKRLSEVIAANGAALKAQQKAREYLNHAAGYCVCQALVTVKHPASQICPGSDKAPEGPDA